MQRVVLTAALIVLGAALLPTAAVAHPERPSAFPDGKGEFPKVRKSGKALVVCKADSRNRSNRLRSGKARRPNRALLRRCRYRHIQQAVDAAKNGHRILVLPGVYREQPSRRVPNPQPKCKDMYVNADGREVKVPSYEYEYNCPNSRNLIAVIGDGPDADRKCDRKCNIQIEGTGARARDVLIVGDRRKQNVIKGDRADGIVLTNFTIQYSEYNNIYVHETDGFRFNRIVSRWSREYGFLSFTSDHGIYEDLNTYGNGDAGVYPGSGPETHGKRYGIHLRRVNSHHNLQGNSGSAGNGLWFYNNRFHHNNVGIVVDSFSRGHPGSPQDSSKWTNNRIYSNNENYFTAERDEYCKKPWLERSPKVVCPAVMIPIGTGLLVAGGNDNIIKRNYIYDNWRNGTMLFSVPAAIRGETDPAKANDTSHNNLQSQNYMGIRPGGASDPNGTDFWWDEGGERNCWENNRTAAGRSLVTNPNVLPACPGRSERLPANPDKFAELIPCASWDPDTNTDPAGCNWFTLPSEPR
ncbi:MAG TPA: hypothetical protein VEQ61_04655 [Thermoleophilaceae bacterium]|nr:hypothetical protein [Thermoleophilaceae bacterium]